MRTLFEGGLVFDGTGADPARADVVVEDGRILDVATGLDGDRAVDVSGRTLLPGLFDCHIHLAYTYEDVDELQLLYTPLSLRFFRSVESLRTTLSLGITTVRDAGGADLGMKRAVEDGVVQGPRMQISLTMLSQTGGHADDWVPAGVRVPFVPTIRGCRRRSSTVPTRRVERCGSSCAMARTSSRSRRAAACSRRGTTPAIHTFERTSSRRS